MTTQMDPIAVGQGTRAQDYERGELMTAGHLACPGCGAAIAMRLALKAMGPETIVVIPACCWAVIPGSFPYTNLRVPLMHTAFETTGAVISGIRASLDVQGVQGVQVMGWAGDGGTFDIGLQSLSAAAERNEDVIYVCYDNEAYMNTGIQRSSATPKFAWTSTTPVDHPKDVAKKDICRIMAAHAIPYIATATPAFPHDLMEKFRRARGIRGFRFIHVLASCTAGWKVDSARSVEAMRLAVDCGIFPLYECEGGERYRVTVRPRGAKLSDYLAIQGRFHHLSADDVADLQRSLEREWRRLLALAGGER
jgi:pyruvate/2-oxoacid:ferredoxin oxidoreductase beta subunit